MASGRGSRTGRRVAGGLLAIGLAVLILGLRGDLYPVREWIFGADEPTPVAILGEGMTVDAGTEQTWALNVAAGQMLIVNAASVELVREDEGSRIENTNVDRILIAVEGGHAYTVTLVDGRWVLVAEGDGHQRFCNERLSRDEAFGVEYTPASWSGVGC